MIVSWQKACEQYSPQELEKIAQDIGEICLLSAVDKEFKDQREKEAFVYRWVVQYLEKFPKTSFFYKEGQLTLGYIVGCPDTHHFIDKLDQKGLSWWPEVYPEGYDLFPVHLHINCHPEARGKGVGGKLLGHFEQECLLMGLKGIHLVSAKGMRNVQFYQRAGYREMANYHLKNTTLVFLGKNLSNA